MPVYAAVLVIHHARVYDEAVEAVGVGRDARLLTGAGRSGGCSVACD